MFCLQLFMCASIEDETPLLWSYKLTFQKAMPSKESSMRV